MQTELSKFGAGIFINQNGALKLSKNIIAVLAILITAVLIFVIYQAYYLFKHQTVLTSLENPSTINLQDYQKNEILKEINELYSFNENNSQAVVGKITDIDRLSSQHQFFKKAKNGDYLLVMPEFTLIYDKNNKQVVDIARENLLDLKENGN